MKSSVWMLMIAAGLMIGSAAFAQDDEVLLLEDEIGAASTPTGSSDAAATPATMPSADFEVGDFHGDWVEVTPKEGRKPASAGTYTVLDPEGKDRGVIEVDKEGPSFSNAKLKSGKVFYGWQIVPQQAPQAPQ